MSQYALLIQGLNAEKTSAEILDRFALWVGALQRSGKLRGFQKLKDGEGRVVHQADSRVVDGPFAESKETISGFFILEAESYEEATRFCRECPSVTEGIGQIEIRQLSDCPR